VIAYEPHPGLFRKFAAINFSVKKATNLQLMLDFASEHGCLIERPWDYHPMKGVKQPPQEWQWDRKPTTLKEWFRASGHLRMAVELWTLINTPGKHEELDSRFIRRKDRVAYRWSHPQGLWFRDVDRTLAKLMDLRERKSDLNDKEKRDLETLEADERDRLETRNRETLITIAKGKDAARCVNDSAALLTQRTLQVVIHEALTDIEKPCLAFTVPAWPDMRLMRLPANLLSYMWLCFARVVAGEIEERPCEMFGIERFGIEKCQKYLYIGSGPGLQRSDTTLCSATCRQRKKRLLLNR